MEFSYKELFPVFVRVGLGRVLQNYTLRMLENGHFTDRRDRTSLLLTNQERRVLNPCEHEIVTVISVFTVRRYALHGLSHRNSVRLSVCHTRALCPHGSTYDHDFFTVW